MREHNIQLMALQEHNMPSSNSFKTNGYQFYMSPAAKGEGVAIVVSPKLTPYVTALKCYSSRLISIEIAMEGHRYLFFSAYAPHSGTQHDEDRPKFWDTLQNQLQAIPKTAFVVVAGDLNTRIHGRQEGEERCFGPHVYGLGTQQINDQMKNRKHLVSLCQ
jgi:hypothetical protein